MKSVRESLVSILAIVISSIALGYAIGAYQIQRQELTLKLHPKIHAYFPFQGGKALTLIVRNDGLSAARNLSIAQVNLLITNDAVYTADTEPGYDALSGEAFDRLKDKPYQGQPAIVPRIIHTAITEVPPSQERSVVFSEHTVESLRQVAEAYNGDVIVLIRMKYTRESDNLDVLEDHYFLSTRRSGSLLKRSENVIGGQSLLRRAEAYVAEGHQGTGKEIFLPKGLDGRYEAPHGTQKYHVRPGTEIPDEIF